MFLSSRTTSDTAPLHGPSMLRAFAGCAAGKCRPVPAACGPQGDTCGLIADCCPALTCNGTTCKACRDDRLACSDDSECCSGYCRGGHCGQQPDPQTCKDLGFDCNENV